MPLASKATQTSVLQQAILNREAFDNAVHNRAVAVVDTDFAEDYVVSPHAEDCTTHFLSPSMCIIRPGLVPSSELRQSSLQIVGSKRAR